MATVITSSPIISAHSSNLLLDVMITDAFS